MNITADQRPMPDLSRPEATRRIIANALNDVDHMLTVGEFDYGRMAYVRRVLESAHHSLEVWEYEAEINDVDEFVAFLSSTGRYVDG